MLKVVQRLTQQALIIIFLMAIITPLTILLLTDNAEFSSHEKRRLNSLPEWHWDQRLFNEFPTKFTAYFDDHYGLRSALIERSHHLKKKYFNKSPTWLVIRGEQDWLFMDKRGSLNDHIGQAPADTNSLHEWQQQLLDKQRWLNTLGIDYFFVPIPNKMTLYSQYLPPRIREHSGITALDQLLAYLNEKGKFISYTNLQPVLSEYQKAHPDQPLYFKFDTHWTSLGAFIAYRHIMQQLRMRLPQLEPALRLSEMRRLALVKKGDLANIIERGKQTEEPGYELVPRMLCASENYAFVQAFEQTEAYKQDEKALPVFNGCANKDLTAVIAHDSYGDYLRPFFSESFKRVIYMDSYDLTGMESFLRNEQPDVYLDLRVERNLKQLLNPDPVLQQDLAN